MSGWDADSSGWDSEPEPEDAGRGRRFTLVTAGIGLVVGGAVGTAAMWATGYYGLVEPLDSPLGGVLFFLTMAAFPVSIVTPLAPFLFLRRNFQGTDRIVFTVVGYAAMVGLGLFAVESGLFDVLGITRAVEGIAFFNAVAGLVVGSIAGYWFGGGRGL